MKKAITLFAFVTIAVLGLWVAWPKILPRFDANLTSHEVRGQFGDSYGSLNTLFTGLAFIAVAASILLQIRESRKRDAEMTRESLEARFFRLNDALRAIVGDIVARERSTRFTMTDVKTTETTREGKDAFEIILSSLHRASDRMKKAKAEKDLTLAAVLDAYQETYLRYQDDLGPYFRMLYRIFFYIERAHPDDRIDYAKIVRAELTGSEVQIIAANGLTDYGKKFKPFILRYHLLKHYPSDAKIPKEIFSAAYDDKG